MAPHKALIANADKTASVVERPLPALRDDYILVKTVSVALNPTDWKHLKFGFAEPGSLVGCDYAGTVEAVGKDVKKKWSVGDKVWGMVHGCNSVNHEDGAFAEYILAKGDVQYKLPENWTFEQAATAGVGVNTVIQGMYQDMGLKWPKADGKGDGKGSILIYGGSTATGYLAIQFAKLSGYNVIATSSEHNFEYLREAGADKLFDYKAPNAAEEIRKFTEDKLEFAFDCVSIEQTAEFCSKALSSQGGRYQALLSVKSKRDNVVSGGKLAYTITAERMVKFGGEIPPQPADKAYVESFAPLVEKLIAEGKIKTIKHRVGAGGLNGIVDGLKQLEENKVTGEKLVYNVADTA